jgi:hypothetical protein
MLTAHKRTRRFLDESRSPVFALRASLGPANLKVSRKDFLAKLCLAYEKLKTVAKQVQIIREHRVSQKDSVPSIEVGS